MNTQRRMNNAQNSRGISTISTLSGDSSTMSSYMSAYSTQLSGWGSTQSRKSYSCLSSLADVEMSERREVRSSPIVGDAWGYFVDTTA